MRIAILCLCLGMSACMEPVRAVEQVEPPVLVDEELQRYCAARGTFCVALGAPCDRDYSPFCNQGLSWCSLGGVCEPFCTGGPDRCDSGTEIHEPSDDGSYTCYCEL